jgi:RNA polymerase sigma factor (sigma-70 family)
MVLAAQRGELSAFGELICRFQNMAYASAYAMLGDFHLAEDVAQEAFLDAYLSLPTLREPAAFPAWFRRIVFKHGDRLIRGKHITTVPLEDAMEVPVPEPDPAATAEAREMNGLVRGAIGALPEHERIAITLFYMAGHSQQEIADFLEVPVTTVKKRLYDARKRLRGKVMESLGETLRERRPSRDTRFARKVRFLVAVCMGDVGAVEKSLRSDSSLVHVTLAREEWQRAEVGPYRFPMAFEYTPLHLAATYGDQAVVETLLAHHADVNADIPGETPLHRAVLVGERDMIDLLLRRGANANAAARNGMTPLHRAVIRARSVIVQLLLAHGADVNARDSAGRTALHWAALKGFDNMVEQLLAAGAAVNAMDATGRTALAWASRNDHTPVADLLRQRGGTL